MDVWHVTVAVAANAIGPREDRHTGLVNGARNPQHVVRGDGRAMYPPPTRRAEYIQRWLNTTPYRFRRRSRDGSRHRRP
jgi:hypothetical protein